MSGRLAAVVVILCVAVACHATEWQLTDTPGDNYSPSWCSSSDIAFHSTRDWQDLWGMLEDGESAGNWKITTNPSYIDADPEWDESCMFVYLQRKPSSGGDNALYHVRMTGPPYNPVQVSLGTGDDEAPSVSSAGVVFHSNRSGHDDIMWMPLGGESVSTFLTTDGAEDRFPCYSPDGSQVAFASNRSGNWDIWVMDAAGEAVSVSQLTSGGAEDSAPSWQPGGELIAFHRVGVGIMAVDVATRLEYQITTDGTDRSPDWSSDGTEIVFARNSDGYHIWATDGVPDTSVEMTSWGRVKALYK